jgi:hypothetical protein
VHILSNAFFNLDSSNENKGGHEKTGETLFPTKCDEIKAQSESYTLNKEEIIGHIFGLPFFKSSLNVI